MAQKMGVRPSEVLHLKDELAAWCFDRAVLTFANHVEAAVEAKQKNARNRAAAQRAGQLVLNKYLYADNPQAPGRFRDPSRR
uniref:Tail assembly chaperone protein n=1 Tax=Micrococcus phage Kurnik TaxID=3092208 RepID=A0AAU6R653_9CAUD